MSWDSLPGGHCREESICDVLTVNDSGVNSIWPVLELSQVAFPPFKQKSLILGFGFWVFSHDCLAVSMVAGKSDEVFTSWQTETGAEGGCQGKG